MEKKRDFEARQKKAQKRKAKEIPEEIQESSDSGDMEIE